MKKIKTYVLIVSQYFPAWHPKAGQPTGFVEKIFNGEKIHTVRLNFDWWTNIMDEVKKGDAIISLRYWSDKPYHSKQVEFKQITKNDNPDIQHVFMTDHHAEPLYEVTIDDSNYLYKWSERELLASNDGLSMNDFYDWFFFKNKDAQVSGAIIQFTGFRYENNN